MDIVLYAFTAALYTALALWGWRHAARRTATTPVGTPTAPPSLGAHAEKALLGMAWLAHGLLLHETAFRANHLIFGFAFALSTMMWLGVGLYWLESWFFRLDGLRQLILPTAAWVCLLPLLFPGSAVFPHAVSPYFKLHFFIANMAYGLLALAAFHALLMMIAERHLHRPQRLAQGGLTVWVQRFLEALPPLLTMEKLLFRLLWLGFICLTLTVFSGILFSENLFGRAFQWNHKNIFAIISWLMFGALLLGRMLRGWRGQQALRWVLTSFTFLLLAYVGSRFVLEVLLQRGA